MFEIFFTIWGWFALIGFILGAIVVGIFGNVTNLDGSRVAVPAAAAIGGVLGMISASIFGFGISLVFTALTLLFRIAESS